MQKRKLREVGTIISGATPKTTDSTNFGGDIPWITPADLSGYTEKYIAGGARNLTEKGYNSCSTQLMPANSVVFSSRAPIGYVAIAKNPLCTNQGFKSIIPCDSVNSEYLYYQLKYLRNEIKELGTGTTFKEISGTKFGEIEVVIPSLSKQAKAVARIEDLFSQLDDAEATLQKTKAQLALYRQAVLKTAFEGNLTVAWRDQHPDCSVEDDYKSIAIDNPVYKDIAGDENELPIALPDSWLRLRMGDVFRVEVGATPSRGVSEYWNGNLNWVSSGEVQFNRIYETKERITEEGLAHASTNIQPAGTIMLAMIGEGKTRGQAAILKVPAAHNQNTAAIQVSTTPCNPMFIFYYFLLNYENTRRVGSGNNQKALNKERVRALRFPFPSFLEQREIVSEIESRLSVYDSIMENVEKVQQQMKALKQSILKEAFEGNTK